MTWQNKQFLAKSGGFFGNNLWHVKAPLAEKFLAEFYFYNSGSMRLGSVHNAHFPLLKPVGRN